MSRELPEKPGEWKGGKPPDPWTFARYARYAGIALLILSVLAWTSLHQRPYVEDHEVEAARQYAEELRRAQSCDRPPLRGTGDENATERLASIDDATGCRAALSAAALHDEDRSLDELMHAPRETLTECTEVVQELRAIATASSVCPPTERFRSVTTMIRAAQVSAVRGEHGPDETLRILFDALRVVDDVRRNQWAGSQERVLLGAGELRSLVEGLLMSETRFESFDDLLSDARVLASSSPGVGNMVRGTSLEMLTLDEVSGPDPPSRASGGSISRPRAWLVANHQLGRAVGQPCARERSDRDCLDALIDWEGSRRAPAEAAGWRIFLLGKRVEREVVIYNSLFRLAPRLPEAGRRVLEHRATLHAFAIGLAFHEAVAEGRGHTFADEVESELVSPPLLGTTFPLSVNERRLEIGWPEGVPSTGARYFLLVRPPEPGERREFRIGRQPTSGPDPAR